MKKRIFFLATMMAIFTAFTYGQNGKKFFKAGNEFMDSKKYEDAVVQYTSAIGIEPSNADYYYARGEAYEAINKIGRAHV